MHTPTHTHHVQMDTLCNTVSALYHRVNGFPIDTYGERIAFSVQNLMATYLISIHAVDRTTRVRARVYLVAFGIALTATLRRLQDCKPYINALQRVTGVVLQLSRVR